MASPYEVLRVDPDADEDEVTRAFRQRVIEVHPDQGGTVAEFRRVRDAYEAIVTGYRPGDGAWESRPTADVDSDAAETPDSARPPDPRVEYLDYEVLDDHGWRLDDDDLFEKAAAADLDPSSYGEFRVDASETLLEAAEDEGHRWPFSCRGGACANCAVAVTEGDVSMPVSHVLPAEMTDRGIRLSCVGAPTTDELRVVFNVKHLPDLDELRLPPGPFEWAHSDD